MLVGRGGRYNTVHPQVYTRMCWTCIELTCNLDTLCVRVEIPSPQLTIASNDEAKCLKHSIHMLMSAYYLCIVNTLVGHSPTDHCVFAEG